MSATYSTAVGCGSADAATGGLPELLRPRFFPGQRLTDADLAAVVGWVRARFALDGLRGGWGVVCGLGVAVPTGAAGAAPVVTVETGFAVDAAGNPLVVREPLTAELPRPGRRAAGDCSLGAPAPVTGATLTVGPYEDRPQEKWAVFDLLLCSDETDAEPVAAGCRPVGFRCEPTRTREGAKLEWVRRPWDELTPPPTVTESQDPGYLLLKGFPAEAAVVFDPTGGATASVSADVIWKWVQDQVRVNPALVRALPGLLDWPKADRDKVLLTPVGLARALFWLADAARRVVTDCPELETDCCAAGVPLARVWVEAGGSFYTARFVDTAAPARRSFERADDGLDPRVYVGQPWEDVRAALARRGVSAVKEEFSPATGKQLRDVYRDEKPLVPGEPVVALVAQPVAGPTTNLQPLAGRVVAFRPGSTPAPPLSVSAGVLDVMLLPVLPGVDLKPPPAPTIERMPTAEEALAPDAVPGGQLIRVAVGLKAFDFAQGARVYAIHFFDELNHKLTRVGDARSPDDAVVAYVRLPAADATSVPVTLLAEELVGARRIGTSSGALAVKGKPLPVVAAPLDIPPKALRVGTYTTPLAEKVLLLDGDQTTLPLSVVLSHQTAGFVRGNLHVSTTKPSKPDEVKGDPIRAFVSGDPQMFVPVAPMGTEAGSFVSVPFPATAVKELWFWLTDAHDAYGVAFDLPKTKAAAGGAREFADLNDLRNVPLERMKLRAEIIYQGAAGAKKPVLALTNHEDNELTLTELMAWQIDTVGTEKAVKLAGKTKLGKTDADRKQEFDETNDVTGKPVKSTWRVIVTFTVGSGTDKFVATADINAPAPT